MTSANSFITGLSQWERPDPITEVSMGPTMACYKYTHRGFSTLKNTPTHIIVLLHKYTVREQMNVCQWKKHLTLIITEIVLTSLFLNTVRKSLLRWDCLQYYWKEDLSNLYLCVGVRTYRKYLSKKQDWRKKHKSPQALNSFTKLFRAQSLNKQQVQHPNKQTY